MRGAEAAKARVRSAGKPRSGIFDRHDLRPYAICLDYFPSEDRLVVSYSVGRPLIPGPWKVAEEDPLEGLWTDPDASVADLLVDVPIARKFLNPIRRAGDEAASVEATDRLLALLRELDELL